MIRLSHGSHPDVDGGCLMEVASLLLARKIVRNGVVDADWTCREKNAAPSCLCYSISAAVQRVNDRTPNEDLWRLAHLLPRLLRARRAPGFEAEARIRQRLAIWAARYVLDRVDPRQLPRALAAIEWAEEHLWDPSDLLTEDDDMFSAEWQPGFNAAARTALEAAGDDIAIRSALSSAISCLDNEELPMFLSDLLDAHEKALAEEGLAIWDPNFEYPSDDEIQAVVDAILASR